MKHYANAIGVIAALLAFHGIGCLIMLALFSANAQTREEVEKRISALPANQQAFERFRLWIAAQPIAARGSSGIGDQVRDPNLVERYRAYLKENGHSEAEIARQVEVIRQQGNRLEAEHWNQYFTAEHPTFNAQPNGFLVEMVKGRKPGRALDVAMRQGRNTIWLAQQGWDAAGFDIADDAVAIANENAARLGVKIKTEVKRIEDFDFGENGWDLLVCRLRFSIREYSARLESRRHSRRRSLSRGRDKRSPHWRLHLWIGRIASPFPIPPHRVL